MRVLRRGGLGIGFGLLACSADPKGEDAYWGTAGYVRDCRFATDSVGANETTPLGVTPADVRAWLDGVHRLPVKYNPEGRKRLALDPGSSEISIELESRARAGWVDRYAPPPKDRDVYCVDKLIIDSHLRLSTADGILSHEMDLSFVLGSPDRASTAVLIPTTALRGAYQEHPMPTEGLSSELWLALHLEVTPSGSSGALSYNPAYTPLEAPLAVFPGTLACTTGSAPMAPAEYAEWRALAVAALNAPSPVGLQSSGASLELRIEDRAEQGCVRVIPAIDSRSLEFAGSAVLRSSDGSIDGKMDVTIETEFQGEALFDAQAGRIVYLDDAEEAAAQAADVITEPLDFSPYPAHRLQFDHRVAGNGNVQGGLRALSQSALDCEFGSPEESCILTTVLFNASWGNRGAP
jgi:hypothetical protein